MGMPKYKKSRDANESEIVSVLRGIPGVRVERLDTPCDLLVGYKAHNILLEMKPSKENRKDQKDQKQWRQDWPGQVQVVTTPEEAVHCVINCYRR